MATNNSNSVGSSNSFLQSLQQASSQEQTKKKNPNEIGKDEFLKMLVTQLKNQDPENPMDGSQFAVQLAQFSQLEQLISINNKIDGGSGGEANSLASYLGTEVVLNTDTLHVENGVGGSLQLQLPTDAEDVKVNLVDGNGKIVETVSLGAQPAGKTTVALPELSVGTGDYKFNAVADTTAGAQVKVGALVAGVVSGFIPGDVPTLLVGAQEISPSDIKEVHSATR